MKLKLSSSEILIHLFSFIIMLMAGYYYLERTLPFDGAFYSFRISETKWFCIDNYRYGVEHTQVIPLLLVKLGCSLKTFLISYSVSFAFCNYIICLVVLYGYKNPKMALGLLLATVLSYMYKFYYPVSEIHSTTAPLFLFAAHIFNFEKRKNNFVYFLVTGLLILWFLFIHVISIIPAFFILIYYVAYTKSIKKVMPVLAFSAILLVVIFMLSKIFLTTEYLASKMIGMKELILFLKKPNAAAGYVYFKNEFLMNYLPLEILGVSCLIFLIIKKEWLQILALLAFTIGTWLIIMAYNLHDDAPIVYMNYYGLFGFYFAFPFCLYAFDFISTKKFVLIYVVLMVCSLAGIIRSGALMTDQVDYFKRVTADMIGPKAIAHNANLGWNSLWVSWDLSFQSLLVSSLQNPLLVKTFFGTDNNTVIKEYTTTENKNCFYNTFFAPGWFPYPFRNKTFYTLSPSNYMCLNTLQDSTFNESLLSNKNVEILANDETIYLIKNNFRTIPVTIFNHNNFTIPSIPTPLKQVNLTYRVYNNKNEMVFHDGKRSTLEADILPNSSLTTGLCIDCTQLHRGRTYFIDVDIAIENKRWLEIYRHVKIVLI